MNDQREPDGPNASFVRRHDVQGVFDAWAAEGRMDRMAEGHLATAGQVLDAIDPPDGGRFLDIGCGVGYAGRRLVRRRPDVQAVAFDAAAGPLARAARVPELAHVLQADATRIPLKTETVEAAFSMEVLYYLAEPARAIEEVSRVLRPGGTFDLMVDYFEGNPYSQDWPDVMGLPMTRWTPEQWAVSFTTAGFEDVTHGNILPELDVERRHRAYEDKDYRDWAERIGSLHVHGRRGSS